MDKNTITGLVLIFLIFIGFSVYNSSRTNKLYESAIETAESQIARGNLEQARTEYINALRLKPNEPEAIAKLNELNLKLGVTDITPDSVMENRTINEAPPPEIGRASCRERVYI